jgi:uncharacterized protein (DUF4415 family)
MKKNGINKKTATSRKPDLSNGVRGKFFRLAESQRMIPLDADIVKHFQRRAQKEKKAYYVLINETLRQAMNNEQPSVNLERAFRDMIADEVQRVVAAR